MPTQRVFSRTERPPTAGSSLELTIDTYLQHIAERELHAGVVANRAAGGTAIIMNPRTGEILAMANEPTFDPNAYRDSSEIERRNRAVQDLYEPGSTFKVVTASAAIEEHVMPVDALIDVSSGLIKIGSRVVHDDHRYGTLSFTDVIVKSSNVGAIKIGFRLGTERLSDFVKRFGFGRAVVARFPRRKQRHRLESGQVDRQRAGLGVDGLSDRRDAAADGRRGQRHRQRRRADRTAHRRRGVPRQPSLSGHAEGACAGRSAPTPRRR